MIIDQYRRQMKKLRVQLTDACNFRCFYCMPHKATFTPSSKLLRPSEYVSICGRLVDLGVEELRLSGGEPTLRSDFLEIVEGLSVLPVKKFGLTTNAYKLDQLLRALKRTRCRYINVSLDSLSAGNFKRITHADYFDRVYRSVCRAKDLGFSVKVNCVIMRGINDHEVFDFVRFSAKHDIEVRFLELMRVGPFFRAHRSLFVPASEIIDRLRGNIQLTPISKPSDSTSFNFTTSSGAHIGFIASESKPFCSGCSRLRLTAIGLLRACMMSEEGADIRYAALDDYPEILQKVLSWKPTYRIDHIEQPMVHIGG